MITDRQKFILDKIVREYIKMAAPVSSQALEEKYKIGIKPASIRLELHRLTDMGYLEQPYISAGRVPTDRGYRFFVDGLFKGSRPFFSGAKTLKELASLERELADSFRFFSEMTKLLADLSSNLALTFIIDDMISFKEGWLKVFKKPEFEDLSYAQEFTLMIQRLEEKIEDFLNGEDKAVTKVLIGKENKISCARAFSAILSPVKFSRKKKGLLALLGPKRMNYPKNIGLIDSFVNFLERC